MICGLENTILLKKLTDNTMTTEQETDLMEISESVFNFLFSFDDPAEKADAAMTIIFQALCASEIYFDDHKWILNDSGKMFRKYRKDIMKEDGSWDEYQESVVKLK